MRRRVSIALCMLLALWQGPLPWLHYHVEPVSVAALAAAQQHVKGFHNGREVSCTGWHIHFAMLSGIMRDDGLPIPSGEEQLPEDSVLASVLTISSGLSGQSRSTSRAALPMCCVFVQPRHQLLTRSLHVVQSRSATNGDRLTSLCMARI